VDYIDSFENEDRELIFRLFATFSRFECSLKRAKYVRSDRRNVAKANWKACLPLDVRVHSLFSDMA
jgi:hypothetical protein